MKCWASLISGIIIGVLGTILFSAVHKRFGQDTTIPESNESSEEVENDTSKSKTETITETTQKKPPITPDVKRRIPLYLPADDPPKKDWRNNFGGFEGTTFNDWQNLGD